MTEMALIIRTLIALVFLTAAIGKARNYPVLQAVVANYRLLPDFAVKPIAVLLPPIEAMVAGGLLFASAPSAELAAAALLILFAFAMAINIRHGRRHIDCGCFQSSLKQPLNWILVARNVGLAGACGISAFVPEGSLSGLEAGEALLAGTVLFVLLQSLNILWSVAPAWRRPRALAVGEEQ